MRLYVVNHVDQYLDVVIYILVTKQTKKWRKHTQISAGVTLILITNRRTKNQIKYSVGIHLSGIADLITSWRCNGKCTNYNSCKDKELRENREYGLKSG